MKQQSIILSCITATVLVIAGCVGGSNSGSGSTGSTVFQSITSSIPGMGSPKVQKAMEVGQLGAKAVDVFDLDSRQRQEEIGQSVAVAITNRYPLVTDQALNDYVNLVGLTIASVAPNSDVDYAFGVLDTTEVGAYSAPGGYIFITRGAVALMQDESELAGVLAHEVAHVALNHGIEMVKAAKRTDLVISAAKTYNANVSAYGELIDTAADAILIKGYSRVQESQADIQAVKYLTAARYDPNGLVRFLQKIQSGSTGMKQLMSTHPGTADRIASVQKEIAARPIAGAKLPERFAMNVKKD